jgi:hypothetical protein
MEMRKADERLKGGIRDLEIGNRQQINNGAEAAAFLFFLNRMPNAESRIPPLCFPPW